MKLRVEFMTKAALWFGGERMVQLTNDEDGWLFIWKIRPLVHNTQHFNIDQRVHKNNYKIIKRKYKKYSSIKYEVQSLWTNRLPYLTTLKQRSSEQETNDVLGEIFITYITKNYYLKFVIHFLKSVRKKIAQ